GLKTLKLFGASRRFIENNNDFIFIWIGCFVDFMTLALISMAVSNSHLTQEQQRLHDQFIKFFENDAEFRQNPNRLYSLAQTFLNVRFLCCSYDKTLMLKIKSMSDTFMSSVEKEEEFGYANHRKTKLSLDNEPNMKKARQSEVITADRGNAIID
uniref:XRN2-binding (XTBD) domain-containing protein n=1 Tax=Romanomermis culicivorax TaxID=13658 RepID=A0A915IG46_ROMCU